jgi:hypothetical protein
LESETRGFTSACNRLGRRDAALAIALAALFVFCGVTRAVFGVCGVFHDDGIYVTTARAIAEGEGYRQVGHPGQPPETKFPYLYPFVLAQIWRIWPDFPANLLAMQGLSLLAGATMVALSFLYLIRYRYVPRSAAAAACALTATASVVLYFGAQTMSEMPFAVLFVAACWALERQVRDERRSRIYEIGLGVLLTTPFLCRAIGVALLPIALVLLYRSKRRLRWVVGGVVFASAPWIAWASNASAPQHAEVQLFYISYVSWWTSSTQWELPSVVCVNLLRILAAPAFLGLEGLTHIVAGTVGKWWFVCCMGLGLVGLIMVLRQARGGRVLPWCLLAYLGPVLIWPWPPPRFLIPVLPLLLCFPLALVFASRGNGRRARVRVRLALGAVSVGLLANGWLLHQHARRSMETGYPLMHLPAEPVHWQPYQDAFNWLRANAQGGDIVAAGMDSMTYLYTGLPTFRPFQQRPLALFYGAAGPPLGSVDELAEMLKRWRARYLMVSPMHGFAEAEPYAKLVAELRETFPGWVRPVYQSVAGEIRLFELQPDVDPKVLACTARTQVNSPAVCSPQPR